MLQGTANRRRVTKLRKQLRNRCRCSKGGWLFGEATGHRGEISPPCATVGTCRIAASESSWACRTLNCPLAAPCCLGHRCARPASASGLELGQKAHGGLSTLTLQSKSKGSRTPPEPTASREQKNKARASKQAALALSCIPGVTVIAALGTEPALPTVPAKPHGMGSAAAGWWRCDACWWRGAVSRRCGGVLSAPCGRAAALHAADQPDVAQKHPQIIAKPSVSWLRANTGHRAMAPHFCAPGARSGGGQERRAGGSRAAPMSSQEPPHPQPGWFLTAPKPEFNWKQSQSVQRLQKSPHLAQPGTGMPLFLPQLVHQLAPEQPPCSPVLFPMGAH